MAIQDGWPRMLSVYVRPLRRRFWHWLRPWNKVQYARNISAQDPWGAWHPSGAFHKGILSELLDISVPLGSFHGVEKILSHSDAKPGTSGFFSKAPNAAQSHVTIILLIGRFQIFLIGLLDFSVPFPINPVSFWDGGKFPSGKRLTPSSAGFSQWRAFFVFLTLQTERAPHRAGRSQWSPWKVAGTEETLLFAAGASGPATRTYVSGGWVPLHRLFQRSIPIAPKKQAELRGKKIRANEAKIMGGKSQWVSSIMKTSQDGLYRTIFLFFFNLC